MEQTAAEPVARARDALERFGRRLADLRKRLHETVIGQDEVIDQLLVCALTDSHALLVGVPGLAKTLLVKSLAAAFSWKFNRIQFTPDLMPADITGYELLQPASDGARGQDMVFRRGPIFANLVLADEINRAAPKTQSALLEAMAERHVTVGGVTHQLDEPFLVVATQNPIEQEGTYPLPEAQLDRFMMEIHLDYPPEDVEEEILMRTGARRVTFGEPIFAREDFLELRALVASVPAPRPVVSHAVALASSSRPRHAKAPAAVKRWVEWGAGPRGSQDLMLAAKAHALLKGRPAPTHADVRAVALPVLRHRIVPSYQAVGEGVRAADIVKELLSAVPEHGE